MDRFLSDNNAIERLLLEYAKYGQLVVAFDFDSTVYDYHDAGDKFDFVIDLLREAKKLGCYLVVWTCRSEKYYPFIREYLEVNDIPYDSINEECPAVRFNSQKIYYNILLDDRAGLSSAYLILSEVLFKIKAKKMEEEE